MDDCEKTVVVIGAGPAGLTAAFELSKAGLRSIVLEKDHMVGGYHARLNTAIITSTSEATDSSLRSSQWRTCGMKYFNTISFDASGFRAFITTRSSIFIP